MLRVAYTTFQSTPVITDERIPSASQSLLGITAFQSTPVITDERIRCSQEFFRTYKLFQSTPVITDERIARGWTRRKPICKFQSTPVITDERINPLLGGRYILEGFNPRPSLLTSESCCPAARRGRYAAVSIHARHY